MTNNDIIRMAREAGWTSYDSQDERFERFAELVRKDYSTTHANIWLDRIHKFILEEREACAKVCDELDAMNWAELGEYSSGYGDEIRKRGTQ